MLVHAFPDADSRSCSCRINADKPFDYHLELGAQLAPLRERGVLIIGSGNVVHNLRGDRPAHAGRRLRLGAAIRRGRHGGRCSTIPTEVAALDAHRRLRARACRRPTTSSRCCTSPAWPATAPRAADVLVDGYAYGSLSMTAYTLDAACPPAAAGGAGAAALPDDLDPEDINV